MSPCAILVTDRQLLPITTGNRLRILGVLNALRELGWTVVLVGIPEAAPGELLRPLVDDFVRVPAVPFLGGDITAFDARPFRRAVTRLARERRPSLVIAEYLWLAPVLSSLPRFVRRVIDCHDVFHERTERFVAAGLHPWAACTRQQERKLLSNGDVVLATQDREASIFRDLLPHMRVLSILTPIDLPFGFRRTSVNNKVVMTVGSKHPGNEAVLEFARDVWPKVVEQVPDARLHVVGGVGSLLPAALPGVDNIGQVADLDRHYAAASVVVCPVIVGTGVKTKMLEALRFGKATVVTPMATEGMKQPQRPAWVTASTLAQCADAIVHLLADSGARASLESAAFAFGERHLARGPFRAEINKVLPNPLTRALARFCS
jgi:succinoglycan biosynthesis protein ExoO